MKMKTLVGMLCDHGVFFLNRVPERADIEIRGRSIFHGWVPLFLNGQHEKQTL